MTLSQDPGNNVEARFAHLLQPIKDLAKNWNIDIASDLEDYLEHIGNIAISFDGGVTTMNFAEAALIIQGSACVYSKKVEYLHDLVKQMLGLVGSKVRKKQMDNGQGDGTTMAAFADEEEEFLSLDDVAEHGNIDLKNDVESGDQVVPVMPKTPLDLMKTDDVDKADFPLLSKKGEVLGSLKDFKLNVCNIHPLFGAMLLDMSHLAALEESFRNKPSSTPFPARTEALMDVESLDVQASHDLPPASGTLGGSVETQADQEALPHNLSLSSCGDENADLPEEPAEPMEEEPKRPTRSRPLRTRTDKVEKAPKKDFWQELNSFDVISRKEKHFKKGRRFQLPPGIKPEETRKRKRGKEEGEVKPEADIAEFCLQMQRSYRLKCTGLLRDLPIPALEPLYWKAQQKWQEYKSEVKKILSGRATAEEEPEEEAEELENDSPQGAEDDDEDPSPLGDDLPLNGDVEGNLFEPVEVGVTGSADGFDPNETILTSYEQLVKQYVDAYLASAEHYAHITDLAKRVSDWENKILPKLNEEDTHEPFDIHKCGSQVITSFPPVDAEKSLPSENDQLPKSIPFRKVVHHKPQYEVCRLFLATLQLANNYNVQIDVDGELAAGMDSMRITLLNTERHCEQLAEYRAPSVTAQER